MENEEELDGKDDELVKKRYKMERDVSYSRWEAHTPQAPKSGR